MRKLVIGMAMASTALTTPAMAREGQWYIQGDGGVMLVEDQAIDVAGNADNAATNYDTGYDFGGIVGYDFGAFRLEAETSYRAADLQDVQAGNQGLALNAASVPGGFSTFTGTREALGEVNALSFMLNGLFDFGKDDGIQAFAGGGVGVARVDMEGRVNANGPGVWNDSDTGFAWQLLAGIRAPLSDSWDVGLKYRYFNVPDISIVDPLGRALDTKLNSHSLLGSITYNFGGAEPMAEPVAVPPPPPPPPVLVAGRWAEHARAVLADGRRRTLHEICGRKHALCDREIARALAAMVEAGEVEQSEASGFCGPVIVYVRRDIRAQRTRAA